MGICILPALRLVKAMDWTMKTPYAKIAWKEWHHMQAMKKRIVKAIRERRQNNAEHKG
jgi:hypothetical protein